MQNLQQNIATLFDPSFESQSDLFHFTERLIEGLPGRTGNTLLLLKIGVPTPSAGIALPRALRERISVQLYLDVGPGRDFVCHERPRADGNVGDGSDSGGPVYRLRISELPVPQKHQAWARIGL
jgi:hypothetical protein